MIKYKGKLFTTIIIAIVFLLIAGGTYAYFSAIVQGNETASEHMVQSASKRIQYTDSTPITNSKMKPGWNIGKTMVVTNMSTSSVTYNLVWQTLVNNLSRKQDLTINITCASSVSGNTCPSSSGQVASSGANVPIISAVSLAQNETHTYSITITYLDQGVDQSTDMGKTVSGKLGVLDDYWINQ